MTIQEMAFLLTCASTVAIVTWRLSSMNASILSIKENFAAFKDHREESNERLKSIERDIAEHRTFMSVLAARMGLSPMQAVPVQRRSSPGEM